MVRVVGDEKAAPPHRKNAVADVVRFHVTRILPTIGLVSPRRSTVTFALVRKLGTALPGVEEGTAWGVPALKLHGGLLACMASHKSAEPDTLVVRIGVEQRDAMIADDPETYYLKPHYVDYPCVLVRLPRISRDALEDLLHAAARFVESTSAGKRRARRQAALPRSPR